MKIIITESQYKRLINEQDDYTEQLLLLINSNDKTNLEMVKEIAPGQGIDLVQFISDNINNIEPPYFYKFDILGLSEEEQLEILKYLFGVEINLVDNSVYLGINGLYHENSTGYWKKTEYDSNNNPVFVEKSNGPWEKYKYDERGNEVYYETGTGWWTKKEFDSNGNQIYWENGRGTIIDNR